MQRSEHGVQLRDFLANNERRGVAQDSLQDQRSWRFADAGVSGAVGQQNQHAGEIAAVRAGNIQQHAVITGDRNDLHIRNNGRIRHWVTSPYQNDRYAAYAAAA